MRAAVLVNPNAGGAGSIRAVCAAIDALCEGCEVAVCEAFGGGLVRADTVLRTSDGAGYVERLYGCVDALAAWGPDVCVIAGGDGAAAYAADRLLRTGHTQPRLIGVAMGTANVGPIIRFSADELANRRIGALHFAGCGAIEAFDGSRSAAFGFNDVVLGSTLLGTVDGRARTLSARAMALYGAQKPEPPCESLGETLRLVRNGTAHPAPLARTAQIIVSCVERERLRGRAVAGMLCFAGAAHARAALLFSERPLVTMDYDPRGNETPAVCAQMLFGDADEIQVCGLSPECVVIADGNPYIRASDTVTFRYRPDLIRIAE